MVKEFIPEGFEEDTEAEESARMIRALGEVVRRDMAARNKPQTSSASQPVADDLVMPTPINRNIRLDQDEGMRKLNGGVRQKSTWRS